MSSLGKPRKAVKNEGSVTIWSTPMGDNVFYGLYKKFMGKIKN